MNWPLPTAEGVHSDVEYEKPKDANVKEVKEEPSQAAQSHQEATMQASAGRGCVC